MTPNQWTDRHAAAVRDAAPAVPDLSDIDRAAVWQRVADQAPAGPARQHRWRPLVAGLVAVGVLGAAGAATADVFSAHTGRGPVDAEDLELGGPGERLDLRAPDLAEVIDEVTTDVRFPSTSARETAVSWMAADLALPGSPEPVSASTGAVRLWMSGHALCAWTNTWAVAERTEDTAGADQAAAVILDARTWTSITDTDPELSGDSEFAWLPDLEHAVRSDDPAAARAALFPHSACMPGLAPELGLGNR